MTAQKVSSNLSHNLKSLCNVWSTVMKDTYHKRFIWNNVYIQRIRSILYWKNERYVNYQEMLPTYPNNNLSFSAIVLWSNRLRPQNMQFTYCNWGAISWYSWGSSCREGWGWCRRWGSGRLQLDQFNGDIHIVTNIRRTWLGISSSASSLTWFITKYRHQSLWFLLIFMQSIYKREKISLFVESTNNDKD